ncbi:MAG: metallophosphoesterase [Clostridia bacterium]|nr:metallophosphoesterase [Clostridia bacterium]
MTYVISDIHGCYGKYIKMLELTELSDKDTLYVLGDVIDRGPDGIKILLDMMKRKNVIPIMGNHESMALGPLRLLASSSPDELTAKQPGAYYAWMCNGGEPTVLGFTALSEKEKTEIINYIDSFMIYACVSAGGRSFHLSHTLPPYDPVIGVHDASYIDFIWGEPDYEIKYDENTLFVTGHTPTAFIDPGYEGRIWQKNNHIAIDCGAVFDNGRLGCICLDTLEEFYV